MTRKREQEPGTCQHSRTSSCFHLFLSVCQDTLAAACLSAKCQWDCRIKYVPSPTWDTLMLKKLFAVYLFKF